MFNKTVPVADRKRPATYTCNTSHARIKKTMKRDIAASFQIPYIVGLLKEQWMAAIVVDENNFK